MQIDPGNLFVFQKIKPGNTLRIRKYPIIRLESTLYIVVFPLI